jgi:hypothetical protein
VAGAAGTLDALVVIPQLAVASEQINSRMEQTFQAAAMDEIRSKADPKYFEALAMHPFRLVGRTVPSMVEGQPDIKLRDTQEARDWQEATAQLFKEEADALVREKQQELQPIMGVLQDSFMLFQNNPDLFPRTTQYDKELADRVMEIGKSYEYRVGGKLIGYHTNMQPIINSIRADLAKSRGVSGERSAQARSEQQRQQAAGQARTTDGQFAVDGPQAGITSKAGLSGDEGEDYSPFISALGLPSNLFI